MSQRPPDNSDDAPDLHSNGSADNGQADNTDSNGNNGVTLPGFRLGTAPNTIARGIAPAIESEIIETEVISAPQPNLEATPNARSAIESIEAPLLDETTWEDEPWGTDDSAFGADDDAESFEPATDLLETGAADYDYEPDLHTSAELAPLAAGDIGSGGIGGPPYHDDGVSAGGFSSPPSRDQELGLMDHLRELRHRILRCVWAVLLTMLLTWHYRDALLKWFSAPILKVLFKHGGSLTTTDPMDGFMLYIQITFIAALLLAMPIVIYQMWAFIEPALTHHERRYTIIVVPFAVLLFVMGSWLGFYLAPLFFQFLIAYTPPDARPLWTYSLSATFLAKMLLCFGVSFQVPVITIFLNKTGIVSRNLLIEYWRHAVVIIFVVVAIITPTWDPVTLCAASIPPCILYIFSIWLVKWL